MLSSIFVRLVSFMRKLLLSLLFVACMLLPAAALADAFTFAELGASFTVPSDKYTIITMDNVSTMDDWLAKHNTTADEVIADFTDRGVLLQAWSVDGDACLEITAVQDLYAQQYHDVNQVSTDERKTYRLGHSSDKTGEWRAQGYDYTSAEWKTYTKAGRFLHLKYSRTVNGQTYNGYARKSIRNDWHFHLDYQVYGRKLKNSDNNALEAVMKTWEFVEVTARPATSAAKVLFTSTPPRETNTGKFTVAGSGSSGLKVVGVVMSPSASDSHRFEAEINSKGKFTMDVKLPKSGLWMMTYTVFNGDTVVEDGALGDITYSPSLLTVSLNTELPKTMTLTGNSLTISGVTMAKTKVQCIVDGRYQKETTTKNSGEFSFTFDTKEEGVYNITLVFEKKGYSARRFSCQAKREFTEEDRKQSIRDEAVKPAYKTLNSKIASYRGRYMVYTLYIRDVSPTSTGYLTFAGMKKTKSGVYQEIVAIRTTEKPSWTAGSSARMYLKCLGSYELVNESGSNNYPYFDLQWVE